MTTDKLQTIHAEALNIVHQCKMLKIDQDQYLDRVLQTINEIRAELINRIENSQDLTKLIN